MQNLMEHSSPVPSYRTTGLLFTDARSTTYACERLSDRAVFQMKVTPKLGRGGESFDASALAECRVLKNVDHQNIIKYVEHFVLEESIVLITEFFCTTTMEKKLQAEGPFQESAAQKVLAQLLSAMNYLQSLGIGIAIRQDGIIINKKNELKLCDFSSALPITETIPRIQFIVPPPEIIQNEKTDTEFSMIFSLGTLIYYCLHLAYPWFSSYDDELLREMRSRPLIKRNEMSSECFNFITGCLELSASQRFSINQAIGHYWVQDYSQVDESFSTRLQMPLNMQVKSIALKRKSMIYANAPLFHPIRKTSLPNSYVFNKELHKTKTPKDGGADPQKDVSHLPELRVNNSSLAKALFE